MLQSLRGALLGLGKAAIEPLGKRGAAATDWREKLLREALVLRLSNPELAKAFDKAGQVPDLGFMMHGGPSVATYQRAGKRLARAVGREAVPLLEAAVAIGADHARPGVALFALAEFKQERSIPVITRSMAGQQPYVRGTSNLAAIALKEFGEKGIAAAGKIPKPDPNKAGYARRSQRHRGATEALALAKEIKGVENIVDGLKLPVPTDRKEYYGWLRRTQTYLQLARKYNDKRLLDPVIKLLEEKPDELWTGALAILAEYDDPRVVPLCAKFLSKYKDYQPSEPAMNGIIRRVGKEKTAAFLLETMRESTEPGVRAGAAHALGHLSSRNSGYWLPVCKEEKERTKLTDDTWKQASAPLIKALADKDRTVQVAAALALVKATSGLRDRAPVKPLAAWTKKESKPPMAVIEYLARSGDPAGREALLAAYRASGRKNRGIADALGKLGYAPAVPDLWLALQERLAKKDWRWGLPELEALGRIRDGGLKKVYSVFAETPQLSVQVRAALVLGHNGYQRAFSEIQELLEELAGNGPWDPRLTSTPGGSRRRTFRAHVQSLASAAASLNAKRAYPVLLQVLFTVDEDCCDRLAWQIGNLEKATPELAKLRIALATAPQKPGPVVVEKLPTVAFLRSCELWRKALPVRNQLPEKARKELLAAGDPALDAMVELCYPPSRPLSAAEVSRAVSRLAEPKKRRDAVKLLALRLYPPAFLEKAIASQDGTARSYALAIRKWRKQDPWFLDRKHDLLSTGTTMLEVHWPIEKLRRFAIAHLDRLAQVESEKHHWGSKPLGALLASIRYSPDPKERELLSGFLKKASPAAATTAMSVMRNGLSGRTRHDMSKHWRQLPKHDYREDYWDMLDPKQPKQFKEAMYSAPHTEKLRSKLHHALRSKQVAPKLKLEIRGFLWHFMSDRMARDLFIADLNASDKAGFEGAVYRLTDSKFAYAGPETIPHLKKALESRDSKRRVLVITRLQNYLGKGSITMAANTVAPFLLSKEAQEKEAAQATLCRLQSAGWLDVYKLLATGHPQEGVRKEAARLGEEWRKIQRKK